MSINVGFASGKGKTIMDENLELVAKIISIEWEMFASVNEGKERASCQEDPEMFAGMRRAQFNAWPPGVLSSYLDDLESAKKAGRNLIEEKYIHMMATTEPSQHKALLARVIPPSEAVSCIARDISYKMLEQMRLLSEEFQFVTGFGRPLYSTHDYLDTSIETYQLGELLTYSEKTLKALQEHIIALENKGESLAHSILENTVKYYGYDSLAEADAAARRMSLDLTIQVSPGCACEATI